jgi:DNA-binding MarR family transcriptional regulator
MTAKSPTSKQPVSHDNKKTIAADAWRLMFSFFISTRAQRNQILEQFSLTPNDARALHSLDADQGQPMRALAEEWGCDASNATGMVDRLEEKGLAERRTTETDRRVKLVVLTPLGLETRTGLQQAMNDPPPELMQLSHADLEAFRNAMARLPQE